MRRLSKYSHKNDDYEISKVKEAVNKLDEDKRVIFDDDKSKSVFLQTLQKLL